MKTLLALIVFAFGTSFGSVAVAVACPNLAGTYTCPDGDDAPDYELTITQRVENDVTIYSDGQTEYIADGKWRNRKIGDEDSPNFATYTEKFNCVSETALTSDGYMTEHFDEGDFITYTTNATHSIDASGVMKVNGQSQHMTKDGQVYEREYEVICQRK